MTDYPIAVPVVVDFEDFYQQIRMTMIRVGIRPSCPETTSWNRSRNLWRRYWQGGYTPELAWENFWTAAVAGYLKLQRMPV